MGDQYSAALSLLIDEHDVAAPYSVNVGCGEHLAPAPWINTDVVERANTHPDLIVDPDVPLGAFPDGSCERIYLGHVIEHVPWRDLPAFLADVRRALQPAGHVVVVGPDVLRVIDGYKAGAETWALVISALEDGDTTFDAGEWPGARHHWNCHEGRVYAALNAAGFAEVEALGSKVAEHALAGIAVSWPVVSYAPWQCFVHAINP